MTTKLEAIENGTVRLACLQSSKSLTTIQSGDIKMKKYYAKKNSYATATSHGFANTWYVCVFDSKKARDDFVYNDDDINTAAIKKSEVTSIAANWDLQRNDYHKPKPFTREHWVIDNWDSDKIEGFIGIVVVSDGYEDFPRLFN